MDTEKMRSVYQIVERAGKSYWMKLGVGFVNRDGSINLKLDALPMNSATLQVREWDIREERTANGKDAGPTVHDEVRALG